MERKGCDLNFILCIRTGSKFRIEREGPRFSSDPSLQNDKAMTCSTQLIILKYLFIISLDPIFGWNENAIELGRRLATSFTRYRSSASGKQQACI